MTIPPLNDNITKLKERVRLTTEMCGRAQEDVTILAVSKTRPAADLRAAHASGLNHFGESYVQEALAKIEALQDLPLVWHFIGPIQSNKSRPIAEHFAWVHSIERDKIARRLNDQRPAALPPLNVCIQVNISGEASKSGIVPDALDGLAQTISELPKLRLRGLMTIPAASDDPNQQRNAFAAMYRLYRALQDKYPEMDTLSMGMSGDFEAAIAEGATLIRPGTALFGPRR